MAIFCLSKNSLVILNAFGTFDDDIRAHKTFAGDLRASVWDVGLRRPCSFS